MGLLLKIILFGVAVYALWKTVARWKGLFDRFIGKPVEPPRPAPQRREAPPPAAPAATSRAPVIDDTRACAVCGAYVSVSAAKCGQSGCPQP